MAITPFIRPFGEIGMSKTRGHDKHAKFGHAGKEIWSRRCHKVNMWSVWAKGVRRITAKYERHKDKKLIAELLEEL